MPADLRPSPDFFTDVRRILAYARRMAGFDMGFSYANLRNFRAFCFTYPDPEICYALRSKLIWTHHRLIMRVESPSAINYNIAQAEHENRIPRTLERQNKTRSYQCQVSSQNTDRIPTSPPAMPSIQCSLTEEDLVDCMVALDPFQSFCISLPALL